MTEQPFKKRPMSVGMMFWILLLVGAVFDATHFFIGGGLFMAGALALGVVWLIRKIRLEK